MGLFSSKKEGGLMDVIRCDEREYLIWKWSPNDEPSRRENAIRYGSSLRVKQGEVAVFVYKQQNGNIQDFIEGPYDQTLKTANFPVLTSIVGAAWGGNSPFQAEVYFINLAGNIKIPFFVNEFDIADPRFLDFVVPVSVKGSIIFNVTDYKEFINLNRMINFDIEDFTDQVKHSVIRYIKSIISNAPADSGIPVIQIERKIDTISTLVQEKLQTALYHDYGVNLKRVDISGIIINKESEGYLELKSVTSDIQRATLQAQADAGIKNIYAQQTIGAENLQESLRIQREETQRAQRLQTESVNLSAHQINIQGDVAKTAAESLGQLGGSGGSSMSFGEGGGMNPAAMMTGMMMGTAVGGGMTNMMGNMMQGLNQPQPPAPPQGVIASYHISQNGQQAGPYTMNQLQQLISQGVLTPNTHVWKQGMGQWEIAMNVPEVASLFGNTPPPLPPPVLP